MVRPVCADGKHGAAGAVGARREVRRREANEAENVAQRVLGQAGRWPQPEAVGSLHHCADSNPDLLEPHCDLVQRARQSYGLQRGRVRTSNSNGRITRLEDMVTIITRESTAVLSKTAASKCTAQTIGSHLHWLVAEVAWNACCTRVQRYRLTLRWMLNQNIGNAAFNKA